MQDSRCCSHVEEAKETKTPAMSLTGEGEMKGYSIQRQKGA